MTAETKRLTANDKSGKLAGTPTVGAGYAKGFVDFALSKGADRNQLLARSQISASDLDDLDSRIPLACYVALLKAGAELTGEPALALQYGEAVRLQEISIVGLICEACATTIEVGEQFNRYSRLAFDLGGDAAMMRGVRNDDGIWIETTGTIFTGNPLVIEAELARLVWNTRRMFAGDAYFQSMPFPLSLHFTHKEPSYRAEYDRVFGAPIVFNSRWNAIRVDQGFFTLRQPPTNRYVFGVLSERAEALLKNLESSKTARGRVEASLLPILHTGDVSMAVIADKLALSRQTLARRLKAEGATFEQVLDELRRTVAVHYLAGKKVSVNETAYLVGFSDPTSFSRAFKRWTGLSPRAARTSEIN